MEQLLAMRKIKNAEYAMDQKRILSILSNVWGKVRPTMTVHHNCVRVFGIVMTIEENQYMYQILAGGCTAIQHIDNPKYLPRKIFQAITFSYNNEKINIQPPEGVYDEEVVEDIGVNGMSRIKITQD